MKRIVFVILLRLTFVESLLAQDTIRVEPSIFYSYDRDPNRGSLSQGPTKYGREDIIFNEKHKIVEYCYYENNKRICFGCTYKVLNDSVLQIEYSPHYSPGYGEPPGGIYQWIYQKKENGNYFVYRYNSGIYESGEVSTLIPFTKVKEFVTMTEDKQDALWIANYHSLEPNNPLSQPKFRLVKTTIKGKIYHMNEVEQLPTFSNGDSLPKFIKGEQLGGCNYGEPSYSLNKLSFIITSNGYIKNIEPSLGYVSINECPYGFFALMMKIMNGFDGLKPAKHLGKNVNVRYVIDVERI